MIKRALVFFNLIFIFLSVGAFWGFIGKETFKFILVDPLTIAQIIAVIALLTQNLLVANMSLPILFFYGTLQLFLGFKGIWLVQANSILVTITIGYIIFRNVIGFHLIKFMSGFIIGVLLFLPVRVIQKSNPLTLTQPILEALEANNREIPLLNTYIRQKQAIVKKVRE